MDLTLKYDAREVTEAMNLGALGGGMVPLPLRGTLMETGTMIQGEDWLWCPFVLHPCDSGPKKHSGSCDSTQRFGQRHDCAVRVAQLLQAKEAHTKRAEISRLVAHQRDTGRNLQAL